MDNLQLAVLFHETYERLAPSFGYETREDTKEFDKDSKNGKLMVAVCGEILPIIAGNRRIDNGNELGFHRRIRWSIQREFICKSVSLTE